MPKSPRSLEQENNLVIVIGAGASVPMGIPAMKAHIPYLKYIEKLFLLKPIFSEPQ